MEEKINILLVEDNPGDARLLDVYLKGSFSNGFSLSTTPFLSKALELLENNSFNIIILDLSLPDSSGLSTFKKMYDHSPETPIIVLTGHQDESTGLNAMKLGAQDFLIKGKVDGKELARSINYSIERSKLLKKLSENSKKLEERSMDLHKERLKLADAQKLAHIGSWEWDIAENKLTWSDELYRIHGMDPKETLITTDKIKEMVHPNDVSQVREILRDSIKYGKNFTFYYRIILPDQAIKTLHAKGEVITEAGRSVKMVGTNQDVTERVHEEEMEKLVLAATQSYNSVIIADSKGKIEWVNEGFTKLTGYTINEVLNTHGEVLRKGNEMDFSDQNNFYESVIKQKKPITYESKNFSKSGDEYWVITTITPILGNDGEVEKIIAIDSDISIRKKMEQELLNANKIAEDSLMKGNKAINQLIKAQKELEDSVKIKEQFLANMSHEIRTPMNAIVGFTNIILKTDLTPEQKQYIEAVKTSGENLLVIINDILDFSKIQSGQFAFEQIELNISGLTSSILELMHQKLIEKNLKLSIKIDEKIPKILKGDPLRLHQILLNLVSNAIKFTQKGEVRIEIDMISENHDVSDVQFSVIDTGIGISSDKQFSIFNGFTQASNETTRKYGGTGLGLTIVKQLIELQGGTISVQSELGIGSVFTFNLKFKKAFSSDIAKNKAIDDRTIQEQENISGLKILLVEDNLLNQILAKKVLTDWNWEVEVAENGLIAIEKLKKSNFDVILMDIQMPEMDGYEATRTIRKMPDPAESETPIIAMTAHAMAGEADKCLKAGMDDYISKPFDTKVLHSKIIEAVKKNSYPKQNQINIKKNGNN
ncbi:MAG: response regulator [Bacteroidia bacterium]